MLQHQHQQSTSTSTSKPILEGQVFARQQLFMALPKDLQEDTKHFRNYVEQDKRRLFQVHSHALVKSVYSVTGKELVDSIIQWLHAHSGPEQNAPVHDTGFAGPNVGQTQGVLKGSTATGPAPTKGAAGSAATAPTSERARNVTERLECAKQIAEALVLIGFITPYTDNATHLNYIAPEHYVHDSELLIPIAPSVTDLDTTSVWSVADGAAYARNLKRKAGMLAPFTDGQHVYVVFNDKTKKAYLFESDLAREPISELSGPTLNVEFDNSHFEFGVRVSLRSGVETNTPETFNAETQERQQELMKAWLGLGATYKTVREVNIETSKADSHGLLGHHAVSGHHHDDSKIKNMSTQPIEGRDAELAYTSLAELEPGIRTGSSAHNPTPAAKHHDQNAANANTASHFVP